LLAAQHLDLNTTLDNDLFNHISYVTNRSLILLRDDGVGQNTLVDIGKMLWRLFNVLAAWNEQKREVNLDSLVAIIREFKGVLDG